MIGKVIDDYVIDWLPIYSYIVGIISVFAAIIIWKDSKIVMPIAIGILTNNVMVMPVLLTALFLQTAALQCGATGIRGLRGRFAVPVAPRCGGLSFGGENRDRSYPST